MRNIRHISRRPGLWPCGRHLPCGSVASSAEPASHERLGRRGDRLAFRQSSMEHQDNGGELRETTFRARSQKMRGKSLKNRPGIHLSVGMIEDGVDHNPLDLRYRTIPRCKAHRRSYFKRLRSVKVGKLIMLGSRDIGGDKKLRIKG